MVARVVIFGFILASCEVVFVYSLSTKATFELFSGEEYGSATSLFHKSFHQCSLDEDCNFVARGTETDTYKKYSVEASLPKDREKFVIFKKKTEKKLRIEVLSTGFEDPGGRNSIIKVNGIDYSKKQRGFNFVVLSGTSGEVISTDVFRVYDNNEPNRMTSYINSTQNGNIILISALDEPAEGMTKTAEQAIHALGATTRLVIGDPQLYDVRYRGSFALVAKKGGNKPSWFMEKAADRGKGPSQIEVSIPFGWY